MTSDVSLPTPHELGKLVTPLIDDQNVGATYSASVLPQFVWDKYNFLGKIFCRPDGRELHVAYGP